MSGKRLADAQIKEKIDSFPQWHYQFDLRGHLTPIRKDGLVNRHAQRRRHFFEPLVDLFGGSLEGKRVLDLASNAGFWSLCAIEAGADFVQGIEGRQMHVDQANFVFEAKEVDESRYDFALGDIFETDLTQFGEFDIVLCLGLMYHISKPVELMEKMSRVNTDVLVIDSTLSKGPRPSFEIHWQNPGPANYMNSVDRGFVLHPNKQAVRDLAEEFGYSVATLKPDFRNEKGEQLWKGAFDYRDGARRAYICSRQSDLSRLAQTEAPEQTGLESALRKPELSSESKEASRAIPADERLNDEKLLKETDAALGRLLASRRFKLSQAIGSALQAIGVSKGEAPDDKLRELQGQIKARRR